MGRQFDQPYISKRAHKKRQANRIACPMFKFESYRVFSLTFSDSRSVLSAVLLAAFLVPRFTLWPVFWAVLLVARPASLAASFDSCPAFSVSCLAVCARVGTGVMAPISNASALLIHSFFMALGT